MGAGAGEFGFGAGEEAGAVWSTFGWGPRGRPRWKAACGDAAGTWSQQYRQTGPDAADKVCSFALLCL